MNDEPHIHAHPKAAEVLAAAAVAGHVKGLKARILALAEQQGGFGLIPDEVPGLINTVRRRFTDLWKEGNIRPTTLTRPNQRGNPETVWVLGKDPEVRVQKKGRPVERDVEDAQEGYGLNCDSVLVTVMVPKQEWERVPSPARVRFI